MPSSAMTPARIPLFNLGVISYTSWGNDEHAESQVAARTFFNWHVVCSNRLDDCAPEVQGAKETLVCVGIKRLFLSSLQLCCCLRWSLFPARGWILQGRQGTTR